MDKLSIAYKQLKQRFCVHMRFKLFKGSLQVTPFKMSFLVGKYTFSNNNYSFIDFYNFSLQYQLSCGHICV